MVHRVGVLVYDGVTLLDIAGPIEVFHEADAGRHRYTVSLVAPGGGSVRTSSGLRLHVDDAAERAGPYDTLLVPGADGPPPAAPVLVEAVRCLHSSVRRIASVCTGSFLLAEAGLLDGLTATTHWRYAELLRRRYPTVTVEPDAIFVRAGAVLTSAGVSAGIDLALALVEDDHGPQLAREVARSLVVFLRRPGGQSQFSARTEVPAVRAPLRDVLDAVSSDPTAPHTLTTMAQTAGVSTRQLARLFRAELGMTATRYVEISRLETARELLLQGASVTAAARRSGFGNDETLRRTLLRHTGLTPSAYRARFASTRI